MDNKNSAIKTCYRYEIFIPEYYNDGRPIEQEKWLRTTEELMEKFGSLSQYRTSLKASGLWREGDNVYYDELTVYRIDIEAKNDVLDFFIKYKEVLKKDFEQLEIYMTRQKIEMI